MSYWLATILNILSPWPSIKYHIIEVNQNCISRPMNDCFLVLVRIIRPILEFQSLVHASVVFGEMDFPCLLIVINICCPLLTDWGTNSFSWPFFLFATPTSSPMVISMSVLDDCLMNVLTQRYNYWCCVLNRRIFSDHHDFDEFVLIVFRYTVSAMLTILTHSDNRFR